MESILHLLVLTKKTAASTLMDVLPIAVILFVFQFLVVRRRPANLKKILIGFVYVVLGLTLFLIGLEQALFPLGETMAGQLTSPAFLGRDGSEGRALIWSDYTWVYIFAAAIGFATTIAEPSLIAVALKAEDISGGSVSAFGLRIAVAVGVSVGVATGVFRIITGTPLPYYIMAGYGIVIIQTIFASKWIIPLAYDSGGVTTSTVTVPVVAALGLGLASTIEGRNPLIDGFGLIAFASLFPIMSVMGYSLLTSWLHKRRESQEKEDST